MDWGSSSSFPESRLLFLLPLLLVLIMAGRCEGCRLEQCTREYDMAREEQGIGDIGPTPESCRLARAYQKCVGSTSKSCRGDINFHFVVSMLERLITRHDCVNLLHKPPKGGNGSVTEASVTAAGRTPPPASSSAAPEHRLHHPHPHTCTFNGRHRFRHCGLFGDPHLKTFDNEYQTCRVRGAWPLIDNPYLAVQVTNEPVVEGSPATATTKVTVIVRGSNRTCSPEKTYEAQSDSPLPLVFIDGTQRSGPEENVLLSVHDEGQRVEIWARHIATRVIVRRAGRYLALSVQLPEELALSGSSGLQLCARGCPASERLDPDAARGQALPREVAMARCRRHMPSVNLSAPYLDWCVFDVMTTGDGVVAEEFVAAAHSAQEDVVRLDPGSLNGTSPGFEPNAAFSAFSAGKTLLSILALLAALAATT